MDVLYKLAIKEGWPMPQQSKYSLCMIELGYSQS